MGTRYRFVCEDCGYSAAVAGGKDRRYVLDYETMTCNFCHELVDVAIGPSDGVVLDKEIEDEVMEDIGRCPECGKNRLSPWNAEIRPCPKCGNSMKLDPSGPVPEWE